MTDSADKQRVVGRPFPPGVSGNPAGRPKKEHTLTSCLQELIDGDANKIKAKWQKKGNLTGAQMTALAIMSKLSKGDPTVLKQAWERLEGRVPIQVNHGGVEGNPLLTRTIIKDYGEPEDEALSGD